MCRRDGEAGETHMVTRSTFFVGSSLNHYVPHISLVARCKQLEKMDAERACHARQPDGYTLSQVFRLSDSRDVLDLFVGLNLDL